MRDIKAISSGISNLIIDSGELNEFRRAIRKIQEKNMMFDNMKKSVNRKFFINLCQFEIDYIKFLVTNIRYI